MTTLAPKIAAADLAHMELVDQFSNEEYRNYDSAIFKNKEGRFIVVTKFVHPRTRLVTFESRLITDDLDAAKKEAFAHTFGKAA